MVLAVGIGTTAFAQLRPGSWSRNPSSDQLKQQFQTNNANCKGSAVGGGGGAAGCAAGCAAGGQGGGAVRIDDAAADIDGTGIGGHGGKG